MIYRSSGSSSSFAKGFDPEYEKAIMHNPKRQAGCFVMINPVITANATAMFVIALNKYSFILSS
jgi:hypothetical protein